MSDFLLELRSEEIPARMQAKGRDDLARLFVAELGKAGIASPRITTYATPRRLVLIAHDLPGRTEPVREEVRGPRASAPAQALEGFLRKTGLTREALTERDGVLFAVSEVPGRETAAVLVAAIPAIVRAFPWPKSMRWGAASLSPESPRWVRPLQGIVALFGEDVVPCEVAGVTSGAATLGHRFHHPGAITIGSAGDYVEKLREAQVIVDQDERAAIIAVGAKMAAQGAGLRLVEDEGLLAENAGLTEWPVPLIGRFDEAFLRVPPEVIQLTARVNQKYFVCRDGEGRLANAFVCTANIDAADGGERIVAGNAKVLAARLSDAKFFYETDLKVRLEDQLPRLEKIVFHEKLGTVADKVERVARLARWLVESGVVGAQLLPGTGRGTAGKAGGGGGAPQATTLADAPLHHPADGPPPRAGEDMSLADMAERAARLAKADLVTGMVGEFPELQGLMGGYYAAAQGEDAQAAAAVRDHYKPVGQGDEVPTAPVTVAVALADKLDTLSLFFAKGLLPTGSRDPFALRRAALGVIELISTNNVRLNLRVAIDISRQLAVVREVFQWRPKNHPLEDDVTFRHDDLGIYDSLWDTWDGYVQIGQNEETKTLFADVTAQMVREMVPLIVDADNLLTFFADRLKVQQREAGVRHDLIDAVFALGGEDDLVRLLARVHALQRFVTTEDGANLLAGYKRAANILRKEGPVAHGHPPETGEEDPLAGVEDPDFRAVVAEFAGTERKAHAHAPEPAEAALIAALDAAGPRADAAIAAERFEEAMAALATLRAPIDAFFTQVTVNDADPHKRSARLALLARVRDAVHKVADFAKIEG